eukprot:TRINITY_DN12188_c0_g1_i2.p1 TRINITY_DN12188_c0_g1~~TRINITY_DN12188_c0_g1_i2.p1  ORF type:complete len:159 (+),score=30.19 TRINITY_DN12188_c0_g1_i2:56-478(+)
MTGPTSRCRSNSCPPVYTDYEPVQPQYESVSVPGDFDEESRDFDVTEGSGIEEEDMYDSHSEQAAFQVAALMAELESLKAKNLELDASIGVLTPQPGQPLSISQRGLNPMAAPFRLGGDSDSDRPHDPPSSYWTKRYVVC